MLSECKRKKDQVKKQFNMVDLNMLIMSEHDDRLQPEIPGRARRGKGQINATSNIKKK
jgi:hypothetical protein